MTFCLVVVYVMENIFSYEPNLKMKLMGTAAILKMADVEFLFNTSKSYSNYISKTVVMKPCKQGENAHTNCNVEHNL